MRDKQECTKIIIRVSIYKYLYDLKKENDTKYLWKKSEELNYQKEFKKLKDKIKDYEQRLQLSKKERLKVVESLKQRDEKIELLKAEKIMSKHKNSLKFPLNNRLCIIRCPERNTSLHYSYCINCYDLVSYHKKDKVVECGHREEKNEQ